MNLLQLAAAILIGLLPGLVVGYWLVRFEQTKEALMSYRDLHVHVHRRLGLRPPRSKDQLDLPPAGAKPQKEQRT